MDKKLQEQLLSVVAKNYDQIADDFNQTRKKALWPELEKLANMVKDEDKVMDVGCGNGRLFFAFKDKKIIYFGVDSSEGLLASAKKNIENLKSKAEFELSKADILELDKIGQADFDFLFCIAVLHHLPGKDLQIKAMQQMRNKLKDGGILVLTVWNLSSQWKYLKIVLKHLFLKLSGKNRMEFGDIIFDWKKGERSQRYYHAFTLYGLKKIAVKSGFTIKKAYKDKYNFYLVLKK